MEDKDMSATDVFKFDVQAARIRYLKTKRDRGEQILPHIDVPAKVREMFEEELPCFLRRQAD